MHRAMHVLDGLGPHEPRRFYDHPYDHPYFGQFFLASVFKTILYPDSLNVSSAPNDALHSIEMLYLLPRVVMGIFAVADTFLLYKIAERHYNRNIAFIASILFAVMPTTWMLRKIWLESLLLPLLLLSILFASYKKNTKKKKNNNDNNTNKRKIAMTLTSGIFLGLSIFTKIPLFTMIPLVGFLIYKNNNNNRNLKTLALWFAPVLLIPLVWPAHAIFLGEFDLWLKDSIWHTQRNDIDHRLLNSVTYLFQIDPVLMILGIAGVIYAEIKRDFLVLLWTVPLLVFLFFIGYISFFHLLPLFPALCIAAAKLIVDLSNKITNKKGRKFEKILPFIIISGIGIFGLVSTTMIITTNVTSFYFEVYSFILQDLLNYKDNDNNVNNNDKVTMIGRHWTRSFYWIPKYVFDKDLDFNETDTIGRNLGSLITKEKILFIVDNNIIRAISTEDPPDERSRLLQILYYNTVPILMLEDKKIASYDIDNYPYASMTANRDRNWVEIRVNY
jgi:Ca2+/Na+ antiporter